MKETQRERVSVRGSGEDDDILSLNELPDGSKVTINVVSAIMMRGFLVISTRTSEVRNGGLCRSLGVLLKDTAAGRMLVASAAAGQSPSSSCCCTSVDRNLDFLTYRWTFFFQFITVAVSACTPS